MAISTIFPSLLFLITYYFSIFVTSNLNPPITHCQERCGHIEITYPFGIREGCFLPGFRVNCNQSIPFLAQSNLQLLEILPGELRINSTPFIANSITTFKYSNSVMIKLPKKSPYTFPVSSNKFIVVGCNALGSISTGVTAINACTSISLRREKVVNVSCSGRGCCQVDVPSNMNLLNIFVVNVPDETNFTRSSLGYGFIVEDGSYIFKASDLLEFNRDIHMKLEWAIGKKNCNQAKKSNSSICGENSSCIDSMGSSGYLCRCAVGYEGNPYLNGPGGCQDIDECNLLWGRVCALGATCENRVPGYVCRCPAGSSGTVSTLGINCHNHFPMIEIVIAAVVSAGLLIPCMYLLYLARKKRPQKSQRQILLSEWRPPATTIFFSKQRYLYEESREASWIQSSYPLEEDGDQPHLVHPCVSMDGPISVSM